MRWSLVLSCGVGFGLVLSVLFTAALFAGAAVSRDFLLADYPPEIQRRYGRARSERGRRVATWVGVLFWGGCCPPLAAGAVLTLSSALGGDVGFAHAAATGAVMFATLTVFDLVILDWVIFAGLRPRVFTLPGTEGMAEYRDLRFHAVAALRGSPLIVVAGLLLGGAVTAIEALS
ncbi:hypothetical protein [Goodfellowiella coeruleoviolacea]|uniref:Uncharacterized protein n=1 Tax=Goodfellowiella coeruleoviolacea TaxID=334858 RepID=A0AAE3GK60_9PSEU|nr:hypothetical protein [Goodfellowiella coeruleoviolacea]MCP2169741.1 hypothetical protein [Goodfellowiella coeruleoviolacea]